jgi:DNA primase catalytic core
MDNLKDKIINLDIVEVIGKRVPLKKAGVNYKGCCPIHKEKTPSFMVSPAKNTWHCFGCGKGGNVIDFRMEDQGLGFREAMEDIAREYHIEIPKGNYTDEDRKRDLHNEALYTVNKIAARYFEENLWKPENALGLEYARSRWSDETISLFSIGFATDSWDDFIKYCSTAGIQKEIAIEAGLIKESDKGKLFDFFRNRLIFPIKDKSGRIVGFSGRILPGSEETAKYINTPETAIYKKSEVLYGLNTGLKTIREKKLVYLVEGNPDVVRLQEIGINNTVAPCGTSLTSEQIQLLKPLVKSINIIGDSDKAGQKAVKRNAEMIIKEGISVCVVTFPEGEEKQDPDSFFTSEEQFKKYVNANIPDYIIWRAGQLADKAHNPDFKAKAVDELSTLVCNFEDPTLRELYADQLGKIISPKKMWTDKFKMLLKDADTVDKRDIIPGHVDMNDFERYGFYGDKDGYHFRTNKGIVRGCNFTMKPLFHIQSVMNAKRLYEIKNEFGHTEVIELLQKDLVNLSGFKIRVESLGNFLWEASESELNKLKRYLYEQTETCIEITQLGWQKNGFFAWANGIYNEKFSPVDVNGIVRHDEKNFYLPAFSAIYKGEDGLFLSERRFIHREGNKVTLYDYSRMLLDVYGDNAMIALCFYFATVFRDFLTHIFNSFPILNLFGPKGAGKTELAVSMLHFYGKGGKGPNINNTTKAALADHVAQIANGFVHIDEYKNNIDFEKIEFLKGLWDGTGRTRMNMDKDKKKETTAVDCGVILSGQEMPTADIALFSRLIYLSFFKTEYTEEEKKNFNELKEIEKKGLTHITHEILSLRSFFIEHYMENYEKMASEITDALGKEVIEDRLFRNWVIVLAAYFTLENKISVVFGHKQLIQAAVTQLRIQQRETRTSNEISTFWNLVQFMSADGLIQEGVDYKIDFAQRTLKTDTVDRQFPEPTTILFIQHSRIIPLYRKIGKQNNEKILPADSIEYYLKHDKRYLGKKVVRFKSTDPKTGIEVPGKGKITNAYAFYYDQIGIILHNEDDFETVNKRDKNEDDVPY